MARKRTMTEYREVVKMITQGQTIRAIQRLTGIHRKTIRVLFRTAAERGWKENLPDEDAIRTVLYPGREAKEHRLDAYADSFKRWVDDGVSFTVMHQLLSENHRLDLSEPTVRRYVREKFPVKAAAVVRRHLIAGETMEVDFGFIGLTVDDTGSTRKARKTYVFSARLKLSGILDSLAPRLLEAKNGSWSYSEFLQMILTDEVERRDMKQLQLRLGRSGLDSTKTLATFDFTFNLSITEKVIRESIQSDFASGAQNILILGPSGVGKSHLAQAIAFEAARGGHDVICRRTDHLLQWLGAGRGDGSLQRRLTQSTRVPILVLDDFGLMPLTPQEQSDLYEIIAERYEKASLIITSNREYSEWPAVFHDPLMASAAMDRLVHKAVRLTITGKSYRTEQFVAAQRELTKGG